MWRPGGAVGGGGGRGRARRSWVPVGVLALLVVPLTAGSARLVELGGGAATLPAKPQVTASPVALAVHIVAAMVFGVAGAMQFAPRLRRRRPRWHRISGRVASVAGVVVGGSALVLALDGPLDTVGAHLLLAFRLVVGVAVIACFVRGVLAIRQGDVHGHVAWTVRGSALALGAGTQVLTIGVGEALFGRSDLTTACMQGLAWMVNLAVAERAIRRVSAGGPSARSGPQVHPFPALAEQAQQLDGMVAVGPEPVGNPGVELGDLAGGQHQVPIGDHEPQPSGEDVQPLVPLVDAEIGWVVTRRDDDLPRLDATGLAGERDHGATVAFLGTELHARIAHLGRADEVVERHLVRFGDGEEQLQARSPLPALEPGEGALGDAGAGGQLLEGHAAFVAETPQARADVGQDGGEVGHV